MLVQWKDVTILVFVLCTGLDALSEEPQSKNGWLGYSYEPKLEGWIKLHTEPADWHTARVKCHMEGAFLASPWHEEFTFVFNKLQSGNTQLATLYSGVHKTFKEGALATVEGKLVISTHPRDLMKLERCGVFVEDSTGEVNCDELLPFVCYRPEPEPASKFGFESSTQPVSEYSTVPKYFTETTPDSATEFVTGSASVQTSPSCGEITGYTYAEQTGQCYKFHAPNVVKTWDDAKVACEKEGAYLAIVNSEAEAQVLKKFIEMSDRKMNDKYSTTIVAAIGFRKNDRSDQWETIFGETLEEAGYKIWKYEPQGSATLGFIYKDGLLYTSKKYIGDPFICEKHPETKIEKQTSEITGHGPEQEAEQTPERVTELGPEQVTEQATGLQSALALTNTPDCGSVGYEYSEETGQCYNFHALAVNTWYDARAACEKEDAYLAIINSEVEAQVLAKIFAKYPSEKLQSCLYTDTAAIGYYRSYATDQWVTIQGETLEQAGYASWRPLAPHPLAKLGFIYRDGLLSAYVPTIIDVPYICEKKPSVPKPLQKSEQTTDQESESTTEQESESTTEQEFESTTEQEFESTTEQEFESTTEQEFESTTEQE